MELHIMSLNHSNLVQRTIDLNYANKKRTRSLKWIFVNTAFLTAFTYDLSCKCEGYTSIFHYVELMCAGVLAANLVQHLLQLLPQRAPPLSLSRTQQKLLGLNDTDLDSSFILNDNETTRAAASGSEVEESTWSVSDADLSLSPRSWRSSPQRQSSQAQPHSSSPSPSPPSMPGRSFTDRDTTKDCFIADRKTLMEYLTQFDQQNQSENSAIVPESSWNTSSAASSPYQLASIDNGVNGKAEEGTSGYPQVWWQLDLDPQRLTQFNLNLRLWIYITILERLVRELERADEMLSRSSAAAPGALVAGHVPLERLRNLARTSHPDLAALLPFLEPYPEQRYIVRRIKELASGECMSAYRWNGGGTDWDESKPTDAELILHLVATYLDIQTSVGIGGVNRGRTFSSEYLIESSDTNGVRRGRGALGVLRVTTRPPHYALMVGDQRLEVPRGRNNLLHTLLCLLAAASRRNPPALARTHLGPAGLNMLWIIGR
ncbi:unnamed protein product [Leptosia nina]|uniref:Transmembrane protein 209 n=1 Tax=Leptosia nina TaxID=320188 RepID=A0AAV1JLI9_9NEOP